MLNIVGLSVEPGFDRLRATSLTTLEPFFGTTAGVVVDV